jgi:hypothetical protein
LQAFGFGSLLTNHLNGQYVNPWQDIHLEPYQVCWLEAVKGAIQS